MEVASLRPDDILAMPRPENVPAERVFDFDIYRDIPDGMDFHAFWREVMDAAPFDVMWTPHNEGHWVALSAELSDQVMSEPDPFSNNTVLVPKETAGEAYRLIPLSLDPPEHRPFRKLLNDNLGPKPLRAFEEPIEQLTIELIESFKDKGRCNFVTDFAERLPVTIFMMLVDLPIADLPKLKHLADQFTRPDGSMTYPEVLQAFRDYLTPVLEARRGGGEQDLITQVINAPVDDRPMTEIEALNICTQVLVGGLDTVVNMLGFTFSYLARDHELRRSIAADPDLIGDALLEFFRRFPVVSSSREVKRDTAWAGVHLRAGDMVMCPTIVVAMDTASADSPLDFQIHRPGRKHSTFGKGSHTCPGAHLARMEMKIVLREWFARIPEFTLENEEPLSYTNGIVGSVKPFNLVWSPAG
ncbi:cytochrome P450 [Erythrobacter sp. EC-HK427]|uniref:cytochrome P450 n=1 Tax=Erythrobacter sp. EC-HK427 TaxID=2038396 RepID=UPI00125146F6|nr:cytochrome P450 [Erythrobacter sp. EC-HK427]VVT10468.1 Camphor 5-monooxygenase [Erythrobacter sp. EC-HK427]